MPAIVAANAGKAVGKDATFEVFAKRLLYVRCRCVVVALADELVHAGQLKPGLEVLGHRLVQQRALGVARVVPAAPSTIWRKPLPTPRYKPVV